MATWYDVLQVSPSASPGVVEAAYNVLADSLVVRAASSDEARAQLAQVRAAIAVLGNAGRRAAYDAELAAGTARPVEELLAEREAGATADAADAADTAGADAPQAVSDPDPVERPTDALAGVVDDERTGTDEAAEPAAVAPVAGPQARRTSGLLVAALGAVIIALLLALGAGIYLLASGDDDERYPANLENDDYDLANMGLREEDVPAGLVRAQEAEFTNEEWAQIIDDVEPEREQNRLDSIGRIRNYVRFYTYENPVENLGRPYQFVSQSTLFRTPEDAEASLREAICDLPISQGDPRPREEFLVPRLGDGSIGFMMTSQEEIIGAQTDTTICFRTGRIVHSVTQRGLSGTEDLALTVRLAQRMLARVDAVFEGRATRDENRLEEEASP